MINRKIPWEHPAFCDGLSNVTGPKPLRCDETEFYSKLSSMHTDASIIAACAIYKEQRYTNSDGLGQFCESMGIDNSSFRNGIELADKTIDIILYVASWHERPDNRELPVRINYMGDRMIINIIGKVFCHRMGAYINSSFVVGKNDGVFKNILADYPVKEGSHYYVVTMGHLDYDRCDKYHDLR